MSDANARWLIVTDLDGTLLNHHDYDLQAARETLAMLASRQVPVVFNTSKTFEETRELQQELELVAPFVVENGSAIYLPADDLPEAPAGSTIRDGYSEIICGESRDNIARVLEALSISQQSYTRLSLCSVEEAVALTGLAPEQAAKAVRRDFSEPLLWHGDAELLNVFGQELRSRGLTTLQGGRFLHVIGQCDKGVAVQRLLGLYPDNRRCVVLGDSPNDAAMLKVADVSIIVRSPSSKQLSKLVTADYMTTREAPAGWVEGVKHAMQEQFEET